MEYHKKLIGQLCRICGRKIVLSKSYVNAKQCSAYQEVIWKHYDIDIEDEKQYPEIFPCSLCSSCKRKIDNLKEKNFEQIIQAANFQPHSEDCQICSSQLKVSGKMAHKNHIKLFDEIAAKYGYVKGPEKSEQRRSYILLEQKDKIYKYSIAIIIKMDFSWSIQAKNRLLDVQSIPEWGHLPNNLNDTNFEGFIDFITKTQFCKGCDNFSDIICSRLDIKQPFLHNKKILANVETPDGLVLSKENFKVARHSDCKLVSSKKNGLCDHCDSFQNTLRVQQHRMANQPPSTVHKTSDKSTTNIKLLSRAELEERYVNAQKAKRSAIRQAAQQSRAIAKLVEEKGIDVDGEEHDILRNVLEKTDMPFEESSPMALLWEQQKQSASKKDMRGMRWHPLLIRWCLSIYCSSPSAYSAMSNKDVSFLRLPNPSTLKNHLHFTEPSTGFNPDIIQQLVKDSYLADIKNFQKNVTLCFDEMKIKSDLVFNKSTGKIIGFSEMGELNEELNTFHENIRKVEEDNTSTEREIASYVLVYMVRGIFSHLTYPIGYFASTGFSAHHLYPTTLTAISVLEKLGFKVRCLTADGASQNRKLFGIFADKEPDVKCKNWGWNPCAKERKLYFMSDVPHLLKTTRNCLENSHGNLNTRNLVFEGKSISWNHIVSAYEDDIKGKCAIGLRFLPKISEEHINLKPRLRMNVKRAAQVLSNSMALALERKNDSSLSSTIKFLKMFDRVFDCLNVSRRFQDKKGKKELAVYESVDDWRFEFLEKGFIVDFLNRWEDEVKSAPNVSNDDKKKLYLSIQTAQGWRMTVASFIELTKTLLREDDEKKFLLSEKFSQDPLEEHFSKQRRLGGSCENPTLSQFGFQEIKLNVMSSGLLRDLRGNSSGSERERPIIDAKDLRQLPTKKKKID